MVQGRNGLLDSDPRLEQIDAILLVSGVEALLKKWPDLRPRRDSLKYRRKKVLIRNQVGPPQPTPEERLRVLRQKRTHDLTDNELAERMSLDAKVGNLVPTVQKPEPEPAPVERPQGVEDQLAELREKRLAQQAERKKQIAEGKKNGGLPAAHGDGPAVKAREEIVGNVKKRLEERREQTLVLAARAKKQEGLAEEKQLTQVNKANEAYVHGKSIPEEELDALRNEAMLAERKAEDLRRAVEVSRTEEKKIERQLAGAEREVKIERLKEARVRTRSLCNSFDKKLAGLREATERLADADAVMAQFSDDVGVKYTGFVRDNRVGMDPLTWQRISVELWQLFKTIDRPSNYFVGRTLVQMADDSFTRVESRLPVNQ